MEKTRKILTLLTILVMALCMTTTVFAEGETGTITITNAVSGQDYNAYRIFDLESYSTTSGAYSYTVNSDWANFINGTDIKGVYVNVDDAGYVTWVEDADAAAFAKAAMAYAKANSISPVKTATANADGNLAMTDLELGYYLVDSSVGTLCELTTTKPTAEIQDKNEGPTIKNEVEVGPDAYDIENTETIGQEVNYKTTINAKEGAKDYVLTVENSAGLTYKEVTEIKLGTETVDQANYTVNETENGFTVTFKQEFLDELTDDSTLEVYYTNTLNENAVIDGAGNTSTATLTYGKELDAEVMESASSTATTYTYEFDLVKTKTDGTVLEGATFKLYDAETAGNEIAVVKVEDGIYRVAVGDEAGVVIEAGQATIRGLKTGTYYLEEVAAPEGYNELNGRASVSIEDDNNNAIVTEGKYTSGGVQVINKTGTELPTTGGMGTTILYIIGGTLMVAAGVTIVARKKMANQK